METEEDKKKYSLKYKDTSKYESLYKWSIEEVDIIIK